MKINFLDFIYQKNLVLEESILKKNLKLKLTKLTTMLKIPEEKEDDKIYPKIKKTCLVTTKMDILKILNLVCLNFVHLLYSHFYERQFQNNEKSNFTKNANMQHEISKIDYVI